MSSENSEGRTVGVLLLLHLALGLMVPFMLLIPVSSPAGFLTTAATIPTPLRAAVLLLYVGSTLPVAIACVGLRFFRQYSSAMAYWLLALAVASFVLQAADNAHLLSMLSLSQVYVQANPTNKQLLDAVGVAVWALRKWSHYSFLLAVGCWIFLLSSFLYRFRLVPRWLAGLGLLGAVGQIGGVTLRALWGHPPEMRLAIPLAPVYTVIGVWLIIKGFDQRQQPLESKATWA